MSLKNTARKTSRGWKTCGLGLRYNHGDNRFLKRADSYEKVFMITMRPFETVVDIFISNICATSFTVS